MSIIKAITFAALLVIPGVAAEQPVSTATYTLLGLSCFPKNMPGPKNCIQTSNKQWGGYCICTTTTAVPPASTLSTVSHPP